jgi:hypothetical protein
VTISPVVDMPWTLALTEARGGAWHTSLIPLVTLIGQLDFAIRRIASALQVV